MVGKAVSVFYSMFFFNLMVPPLFITYKSGTSCVHHTPMVIVGKERRAQIGHHDT